MRFQIRIVFIISVAFILFISFKILEPEIRGAHPEHDDWGGGGFGGGGGGGGGDGKDAKEKPQSPLQLQSKNAHRLLNNTGHLTKEEQVKHLLKAYSLDWEMRLERSPWATAAEWVTERRVHPDHTPEMGAILREMSSRKIVRADVGRGGTQLKMTLILEGGQQVVFKPKWFERDTVIEGRAWNGADRHNGEIASFHLNRLMGFNIAPLSVGRVVDMEQEIKPVAQDTLLNTFFEKDGNTCFYGKCYYCKGPETGVCGSGNQLEGTVILWLPPTWRLQGWKHPWRRSYTTRIMKWETDPDYCYSTVMREPLFNRGPRLLDLIDIAVFDYLIYNGDRHNYLTFSDRPKSVVLLLDNGKSFSNPYLDDDTILAPLEQCCRLRHRTWKRLKELKGGILSAVLSEILRQDPIAPVLKETHLEALDRRLEKIVRVVDTCVEKHGMTTVFLTDEEFLQPKKRT